MKLLGRKWLIVGTIFGVCFGVLAVLVGTRLWYLNYYVHQHCIKVAGITFEIYAGKRQGQLPYSTNGFGDALLLLAKEDPSNVHSICGPGDDGHLFQAALTNNSIVPAENCSRVYVQGLSETNDPMICILFDRNSCRSGDHFRSPWGHRVRDLCLLDGAMEVIPDEKWPEFSRQQVDLLIAAGFSRTNALCLYPAAR